MDAAVATSVFVIAFTAAGCPPCDDFKRDLATGDLTYEVQIVVVDIAEQPDLAKKCGVERTPTFVAIEDERQVSRLVGYRGRGPLRDWLARLRRE
jgi:thioredoxin-like negative regulator of GroEL